MHGLTSCPKMRVHISAPVSSASAITATPSVATACTAASSLLASFSFSFSLLLLSFDLPAKFYSKSLVFYMQKNTNMM